MKIKITGTLEVPFKYYGIKLLTPYIYAKKGGDKAISFFVKNDETIHLPRNFRKFLNVTGKDIKDLEITDGRLEVPLKKELPLKQSFGLRDYQEQPVEGVIDFLNKKANLNSCVLQADPGFGKTYILPKIVQKMNQRTLILVDRTLLVKQMHDEFVENTDADIRILTSGDMTLGDVNIATLQLFIKSKELLEGITDKFGFVIVDECHIAPAIEFSKVISRFPAKYRLGLSATPTRSDGLTEIISDTFSSRKVLGVNPKALKVTSVGVRTGIKVDYQKMSEFSKAFIKTATSPEVLAILKETVEAFIRKDRKIMVYATFTEIHNSTKTLLESIGLTVGVISSKVSHKERDRIIALFNSGEIDVLISGVIMSKGVSVHRLDTIINLSTHNKESLEQTIGRLRREHDDKQKPLYVDISFTGKLRRNTEDRFELLYGMQDKGDRFFAYTLDEFKIMLRS